MVARILFTSEIYIKGDSIDDIKKRFCNLVLFPDMTKEENVEEGVYFYNILAAEDADTNNEIPFDL